MVKLRQMAERVARRRRPRGRFTLPRVGAAAAFLGAALIWATPDASAGAPVRAEPGGVQAEVRDGLLTLDARDAPLDSVLRAIGEQAGFDVVIEGNLGMPVSRSFAALPLGQGIRHVMGGTSYVMTYGGSGEAGGPRLLRAYGLGESGTGAEEVSWPEVRIVPDPTQADMEAWILERLTRADRGARIVAVRRVERLEHAVALDIAAQVLGQDGDPVVRGQAAAVLGRLGGDRAAGLLEAALEDADASVRRQAAHAMGALDGDEAIHDLGRVLLRHPDREVRLIALESLASASDEVSRSYLEAGLTLRDAKLREAVKQALDRD